MIDCNEWRTEKRHECANMEKVKRLELWWQLYHTSFPVWDLENFRPMDFCWHECTYMRNCTLSTRPHEMKCVYITYMCECKLRTQAVRHCNTETLKQRTECLHECLHTGNANKDIWSDYSEWVCVLQPAGNCSSQYMFKWLIVPFDKHKTVFFTFEGCWTSNVA